MVNSYPSDIEMWMYTRNEVGHIAHISRPTQGRSVRGDVLGYKARQVFLVEVYKGAVVQNGVVYFVQCFVGHLKGHENG